MRVPDQDIKQIVNINNQIEFIKLIISTIIFCVWTWKLGIVINILVILIIEAIFSKIYSSVVSRVFEKILAPIENEDNFLDIVDAFHEYKKEGFVRRINSIFFQCIIVISYCEYVQAGLSSKTYIISTIITIICYILFQFIIYSISIFNQFRTDILSSFIASSKVDYIPDEFIDFFEKILPVAQKKDKIMLVIYAFNKKYQHNFMENNFPIIFKKWVIQILDEKLNKKNTKDEISEDEISFAFALSVNNFCHIMLGYPCGEKENNIEIAIAGFEALNKYDEQLIECVKRNTSIFPFLSRIKPLKGRYKNNLGVAYTKRIKGDVQENIEKAIQCFEEALETWTLNNLWDWILIRRNLGGVYLRLRQGDSEKNIRIGIQYLAEALKVCSLYQQHSISLLHLLGIAYLKYSQISLAKKEYLKIAIYFFKLSYTISRIKDVSPEDKAYNLFYIGQAYKLLQKNTEAIQAFKDSLEILKPVTYPIFCIEAGRTLGDTAFNIHEWDIATQGYSKAIEALELVRNVSSYNKQKEKFISDRIDLYANIVKAYIKLDKPGKALEYIELSKTRNLADMLNFREHYPENVTEEIRNKLDKVRREWRATLQFLETEENKDAKGLYTIFHNKKHKLEKELDQLTRDINNHIDPDFNLTKKDEVIDFYKIKQLLSNHQTALVEWYITEDTFFTFIITSESSTPIVWQSTSQDLKALKHWCNEYCADYDDRDKWLKILDCRLNKLASILHIDKILDCEEIKKCNRLILIPHRYLHLFPLHALPLSNGKFLCEHFPKGIGYVPSCQLLQLAQNKGKNRQQFKRLFAIENPTRPDLKPLVGSKLEINRICQYFVPEDSVVISGDEASEATLTERMAARLSSAHCVHFSCHGKFSLEYPLESALQLAPSPHKNSDEKPDLTLTKIFAKLNLDQCRLVTLSACESGMTDPNSISDEYIGLPSGFLYAGTPSIVSTLWRVDPLATTLLLIKFYKNLKRLPKIEAGSVALSLNQAQIWLRTLNYKKLLRIQKSQNFQLLLEQIFDNEVEGEKVERKKFDDSLYRAINCQPYPFAKSYYWSSFVAIGL